MNLMFSSNGENVIWLLEIKITWHHDGDDDDESDWLEEFLSL